MKVRPRAGRATGLTLGGVIVLMALAAAGCGSTNGGGPAPTGPVATTSVDLPPSYRFAPADISVRPGATVTWTNHDNFTHSIAFLDGGLPSAPIVMKPSETATFTFPTSGLYHYQCSFHPQNMKGSVVVGS